MIHLPYSHFLLLKAFTTVVLKFLKDPQTTGRLIQRRLKTTNKHTKEQYAKHGLKTKQTVPE
jgi:hypothetical protein